MPAHEQGKCYISIPVTADTAPFSDSHDTFKGFAGDRRPALGACGGFIRHDGWPEADILPFQAINGLRHKAFIVGVQLEQVTGGKAVMCFCMRGRRTVVGFGQWSYCIKQAGSRDGAEKKGDGEGPRNHSVVGTREIGILPRRVNPTFITREEPSIYVWA